MEKAFTIQQVADKYAVTKQTVYDWIAGEKLNAIKTGKLYRIRPQDLERFEKELSTKQAN